MNSALLPLLPPLLAVLLAILSRRVHLALLTGIIVGAGILAHEQAGTLVWHLSQIVLAVLSNPAQASVIAFTALMGALVCGMTTAGGIEGFINWAHRRALGRSRRSAQLFAWSLGLGVFIETTITCLVVGTVARPLFDKLHISREKLAYICDTTSAPVCILLPFNGWGATILGLLSVQAAAGHLAGQPELSLFIAAMPFNFYAIVSVLVVWVVCYCDWHIGPMKRFEQRAANNGNDLVHSPSPSSAALSTTLVSQPPKQAAQASMMMIPLISLFICVLAGLIISGIYLATHAQPAVSLSTLTILHYARGAESVLFGVCTALCILASMMWRSGNHSLKQIALTFTDGIVSMQSMAWLMLLAFALGTTCQVLSTGEIIASLLSNQITLIWLVPLVFITSCLVAFATGTSFGTFALMIPLAIPLATHLAVSPDQVFEPAIHLPWILAAVLGGGVFGDHCSPISDTTVISSLASGCEHMDHVVSQLPYALITAGISLLAYIVISWMAWG